jgi:hypothetical protein
MSGDVVKLRTVTTPTMPVDEDLVSGLETLLQMAKEGRFQGLAYVMVQTDGVGCYTNVGTGWRGRAGAGHVLLGGLSVLEHRLREAVLHDGMDA